jgi:hypothetical protein
MMVDFNFIIKIVLRAFSTMKINTSVNRHYFNHSYFQEVMFKKNFNLLTVMKISSV